MTIVCTDLFITPNVRLHKMVVILTDNATTFGRDDLKIRRFNNTYIYSNA